MSDRFNTRMGGRTRTTIEAGSGTVVADAYVESFSLAVRAAESNDKILDGLYVDESCNHRTGVLIGTPIPAVIASPWGDAFGNALDFDGTNNADGTAGINCGVIQFSGSQPFTIDARIRRDVAGTIHLIAASFGEAISAGNWEFFVGSANLLHLIVRNAAGSIVQVDSSITIGSGVLAVVRGVYDGSVLRVFIDGILRGTSSTVTGGIQTGDGITPMMIGRNTQTSGGVAPFPFNGVIDEVRVSSIARSTANYTVDSGPFACDADTVGCWHLDAINSSGGPAFAIALAQSEAQNTPDEAASLGISGSGLSDSVSTPTEGRQVFIRCWASGCTTNETATGNDVNPSRANGQNDGSFAQCHTGSGTPPSTVNPNTVTTGSMNVPGGLTVVTAKIRMFFKTGAILAAVADNLNITYSTGGGPSGTVWQGPALATLAYPGEDYSTLATSYTFDVSSLTLTQLQNLQLVASYNAGVLALPQTVLQIDAWCVEIEATI